MGVITTGDIAEGASFGPIPRSLTLVDLTQLIGHMTCDSRPDVHTVKVCSCSCDFNSVCRMTMAQQEMGAFMYKKCGCDIKSQYLQRK